MQPQQPRTYRVLLHKKGREALNGTVFTAILDFSPGPGLFATHGLLTGLVHALAYRDGARGPETLHYSLEIVDPDFPREKLNWAATSWQNEPI